MHTGNHLHVADRHRGSCPLLWLFSCCGGLYGLNVHVEIVRDNKEILKNALERLTFSYLRHPCLLIFISSLIEFASADFCTWLMSHVECEGQDIVLLGSRVSRPSVCAPKPQGTFAK